jgi:iron complex outermembrane recepter protein
MSRKLVSLLCGSTSACAVLAVAAAAPSIARAQDTPPPAASTTGTDAEDEDAAEVAEVTVTLRKREEVAQDVPITVTAMSGETIREADVRNTADLTNLVPALRVAPTTNVPADARITLRGQSPIGSLSIINDTPVALYVDGVYYGRTQGILGNMLDVAALEVDKGPQGTLVGRNSTGGAILIRNREPGPEFGGWGRVVLGDYGRFDTQAVVNLPLNEKLFARVAFSSAKSDGYLNNVFPGTLSSGTALTPAGFPSPRSIEDFGTQQQIVRAMLKWEFDETLSALFSVQHREEDGNGTKQHVFAYRTTPAAQWNNQPTVPRPFPDIAGRTWPQGTLVAFLDRQIAADIRDVETLGNGWSRGEFTSALLRVDKDFGAFQLRGLAAYQRNDQEALEQVTQGPIVTQFTYFPAKGYEAKQAELTLLGDLDVFGRNLSLTSGLFYFDESNDLDGVSVLATVGSTGPSPTNPASQLFNGHNTSYAAYIHGIYEVMESVRLTLGGRYSFDRRQANQYNRTALGCTLRASDVSLVVLDPCHRHTKAEFDAFTYTATIDWRPTDQLMLYATARSGYKAGGINGFGVTPAVLVFRPENARDVEVGVKSDWIIGSMPVRFNFAAFHTDFTDQHQQLVVANVAAQPACVPGTPSFPNLCGAPNVVIILNSAKSRIQGLEAEFMVRPTPDLRLSVAGAYVDGRFVDYSFTVPTGFALNPGAASNLTGRPFAIPRTTIVASATYALPISRLAGVALDGIDLRVDATYVSETPVTSPISPDPLVTANTKPTKLVNARVSFRDIGGSRADLSLFARNLFNYDYYTSVSGPAVGNAGIFTGFPNEPRTVGVELSYAFGGE